ncbi:M23 family metallopeptidase [Rhodococcus sp. G-MC3]|uniref:M23 family metallopeptidase n=1 Tax=Rhodococcus sp. G-MC3 TaxID=3046209 RepID=UPI0024BB1DF9|nr:M23 family metallopeptidase [Rhodococcus sp. G-MC3]MDJ0391912.1 M23 family metallopeptidase [Rhodococcus sp. G-MC3]
MNRLPALLAAALISTSSVATAHAAPPTTGRFLWPLIPRPAISNAFDPPERDWLPGHRGVDLAGAEGQAVHAVGDGVVVFAGTVAGKPVVSVEHSNGLRSTYEPVLATLTAGARIRAGDVLGLLQAGHPGCAEPCLHWGLRRDRVYLDPLGLLGATPIRLKPLTAD